MRIKVELYGHLKAFAKTDAFEFALVEPANTIKDLLEALVAETHLPRERFEEWVAVAVGDEIVGFTHRVRDGDVVSLLPPVSGG